MTGAVADALGVKLPLVEFFRSIQGEGRNVGRLALFIRFAGCNLDCQFADGAICDTPWQTAREKRTITELALWARAHDPGAPRSASRQDWPMVVITGGEPTAAPMFDELVQAFHPSHYVAIESNGTRWREGLDLADWVTVSPKDLVAHRRAVDPTVDPWVAARADEIRVVIGPDSPTPLELNSYGLHYVSPAMMADGRGQEAAEGVPGFVPGALSRCKEIIQANPRWRLSLQTHKWIRAQ